MEEQRLVGRIPREQTCLISDLIKQSGVTQKVISRRSQEVVNAYKDLGFTELPNQLTPPTVSRMKTGSNLKNLKRSNLRLLYLTIAYLKLPRHEGRTVSLRLLEEAEAFADDVLRAGAAVQEREVEFFNANDPRHDRTEGLFGSYGINLLEYAIAEDDADSFRKLAVLQRLSGNTDDSRYWADRASKTAPQALEILNAADAAREAFAWGRLYLLQGERPVAEIYLTLAADAGLADAAFLLGEVLEALQRDGEAQHWFSAALRNGHGEAGVRLAALEND